MSIVLFDDSKVSWWTSGIHKFRWIVSLSFVDWKLSSPSGCFQKYESLLVVIRWVFEFLWISCLLYFIESIIVRYLILEIWNSIYPFRALLANFVYPYWCRGVDCEDVKANLHFGHRLACTTRLCNWWLHKINHQFKEIQDQSVGVEIFESRSMWK